MQTKFIKRYFSQKISPLASASIRRFGWAIKKSMPATIDLLVKLLPLVINPKKVCPLCKDNSKCDSCVFSKEIDSQALAAALEAVF